MPAIADYNDLRCAHKKLQRVLVPNPRFHLKLVSVLWKASRKYIRFGWACKEILAESSDHFDYYWQNPGTARILKTLQQDLRAIKYEYFAQYCELRDVIKQCRMAGYDNLCRMILGETPEELKGLAQHSPEDHDSSCDSEELVDLFSLEEPD